MYFIIVLQMVSIPCLFLAGISYFFVNGFVKKGQGKEPLKVSITMLLLGLINHYYLDKVVFLGQTKQLFYMIHKMVIFANAGLLVIGTCMISIYMMIKAGKKDYISNKDYPVDAVQAYYEKSIIEVSVQTDKKLELNDFQTQKAS